MHKESQEPSFSSVTSHTSFVSHQTDSNCTGADAENIMRSNRIEKISIVKITRKRKKKPKKKPEVLNRPHKISLSTPNVSDVCLAFIYKIHNHRQYKKNLRLLRNFILLDRTRNMGGDISGWSARQICHYDERDLSHNSSQSLIFYNLTNLYRIQFKKNPI